MIKDFQSRFNAWGQKSNIENKKAKAYFAEFTKQKSKFIFALDSLNVLMYSDSISTFLNLVKDNIVRENKILKSHQYQVFTYRNLEPNAYNLGEGIILISTGLLERIKSVDQLAFVISHEISHDFLNHVYSSNKRLCESLYDSDFKKILQKKSRKQAGRNTEIKNIINSFVAVHMGYSRDDELQADSLGYILYTSAGYKKEEAINLLNILDASDHLRYLDTLNLQKIFDFKDYPFKSYWLSTENSKPSWKEDPLKHQIPDSLKSHPDCSKRITKIQNQQIGVIHGGQDHNAEIQKFSLMSSSFNFEALEAVIQAKDYVVSLYLSLHMQEDYPDNVYLKCVTANSLIELAEAMSRNEYLEYVEFPDEDYSNGYNHILTFLHNMNSATLRNLFHYYFDQNLRQVSGNSYIGYLKILGDSNKNLNQLIIEKYLNEYKDKYFVNLLENKVHSIKNVK